MKQRIKSRGQSKDSGLIMIVIILFAGLLLTYWNHFDNDFHFDDFHTITQNPYVRSTENIPDFFTNYQQTQSTRPVVKTYRPLVTTMNAISYSLGGGYKPFYFHLTIFIFFILQLVLMYFLFLKILRLCYPHRWNTYISLFAVALYAFHTANAETVNYIIARSDSMSALFVIMALTVWAYFPRHRKYGYYLIPALLGMFAKEQAAMFAPLLLAFIFLIEQQMSVADIFSKERRKDLWAGIKKALPALVIIVVITYIIVFVVRISKEPDYGHSALEYAWTQPYIWLHYFITFFYPYHLSADPDMKVFRTMAEPRMWLGFAFFAAYIYAIIKTSLRPGLRPVSFGLIWFGVVLLPTSSIFPLGQVTNDHRMFFPFVGLSLSVSWALGLLVLRWEERIRKSRRLKYALGIMALLVLTAHALGANHRNKVWHSEETLWGDAVEKSPNNARTLMNYGLTLMSKGEYNQTRELFLNAYELNPNYNYLLVNLGILYNAMEKPDSAQLFYNRALEVSPRMHVTNYYYARHLFRQDKMKEALKYVNRAIDVVPHYLQARHLKMNILFQMQDWETLEDFAEKTLQINKDDELASYFLKGVYGRQAELERLEQNARENPDPETYVRLSLNYYKNKQYEKAVEACKKALEMDPEQTLAYNNMGSAYIALEKYEQAVKSLEKALSIRPDFQRAKNNLRLAKNKQKRLSVFEQERSHNEWINKSLEFYRQGDYLNCIRSCRKALSLDPNSALAYNNICSAYNKLGEHKKAVEACEKALEIDPHMERAENNLRHARKSLD